MSNHKPLEARKSGAEIIRYCEKHPSHPIVEGGGRHMKVRNEKGTVAVPDHPGDLPTGTWHSIIKALAAIGITALALLSLAHFALHLL